jgi:ABC-2 type transport system ATP-binding protein
MDEASRCHKLAYIAYGRLLAQGTVAEVIASQGLTTFAMIGPDLASLSEKLQGKPGVEQTAAFGDTVHVTGKDGALLEATLREVTQGTGAHFAQVETGLEDVFIHLMQRATDNWGGGNGKPEAKT